MNDPMINVPGYRGGGIPFFAAASVSLGPGQTAPPFSSRQLGNPYRQAMVIDEIHFQITLLATEGVPLTRFNLGGSVRARFKLGRVEVSNEFIPIWNYGTRWDDDGGSGAFGEEFQSAAGQTMGGVLTVSNSVNYYRWILPKPLYIPAGNILQPSISREQDALAQTANVWVGYGCRRLAPHKPPTEFDVPYVAQFITDPVLEGSSPSTFQSSEKDLVNIFQQDVRVQRFTGRVQKQLVVATVTELLQDDLGSSVTLVMKDSTGVNIIRDFTPWNHVFDRNRRAWTFNRILKGKERYNVSLANVSAGNTAGQFHTPMIAMIGTRREQMVNV